MTAAKDDADKPGPSPRTNPDLVGHAAAEAALLRAHASGRLAHAWLITGPRGIGKATLAYRFARFVLAGGGGPDLFGGPPESLHVDPESGVFRRVASGGHADLFTVERSIDPKSERRRGEIVAADARAATGFLHLTPAEGGWRVVVVDSADELNVTAANALLKIVEEPPERALILMVSHAPSRLLPTIRSRCRKLALQPLDETLVLEILATRRPDLEAEDRVALARLAEGSAGRALELADAGGVALYRELAGLFSTLPSLDVAAAHALADKLARRGAEDAYRVVAELLDWWIARLVRSAAEGAARTDPTWTDVIAGEGWSELAARLAPERDLDRWARLWEKTTGLLRRAESARLDRKQVLLNAFLALESTARA